MEEREAVGRIVAGGVVAVLRLSSAEDLLPTAQAIASGGVAAVEFTMTTPGVLRALEAARGALGSGILLGVGTVLDADAARDAVRAGAAFLVAPNLDPEVVRAGREAGVPVIPGALTPTEIVQAWKTGASLVKLFPASAVGPRYVKELQGPLPHIPLIPTGSVSLENAADFIRAGAAAVGVGGEIVSKDLLARRAFGEISARAHAFVEAVKSARGRPVRSAPPIMPVEGPDVR